MVLKRREILKAAVLGSSSIALSTSTLQKTAANTNREPADILIVGAGNAGIPAAIEAADLGAKVILIDKNTFIGGMLIVSGGHISGANAKMQMRKNIKDSYEKHYQDAMKIGKYQANSELLSIATENAASMIDWLEEIGVEFTEDSPMLEDDHDHYSVPRTYVGKDLGRSLLRPLNKELNKRIKKGNLQVLLDTKALNLVQNEDKEILGVRVQNKSGNGEIYAKTVILATGGYGASKSMKKKYNPKVMSAKWVGLPHATGDGINMAMKINAKLVNMDHLVVFPGTIFDFQGTPTEISTRLQFPPKHFTKSIWINSKGSRFINEHGSPDEREVAFLNQDPLLFYVIFDDSIKKTSSTLDIRNWNKTKLDDEISKGQIITSAKTIEELARKINVSNKQLQLTVNEYNKSVNNNETDPFGRNRERVPITSGPFYAFTVGGSILTTHGGISVNHSMEVTDNGNQVIPGLYAAGEVLGNGQLMGHGVVGGMSVGPAITFGRMAARTAHRFAQCLCLE